MSDESSAKVLSVLCIPGPWKSRDELVKAVVESNDGKFLIAGNVLFRPELNEGYDIDVCTADPRMHASFMVGGQHWKDSAEMARIAEHKRVVYIVEENGGSIEKAARLMHAAIGLLNAGGFGVKVESSGMAHTPDSWRDFAKSIFLDKSLHASHVIYLTGDDCISCGMHILGYKDAIVAEEDAENPVELLQTFTHYMVMEKPVLGDGHTFRTDSKAPRYRMTHEPCTQHDADSLFFNPFGMWRLRPVAKD